MLIKISKGGTTVKMVGYIKERGFRSGFAFHPPPYQCPGSSHRRLFFEEEKAPFFYLLGNEKEKTDRTIPKPLLRKRATSFFPIRFSPAEIFRFIYDRAPQEESEWNGIEKRKELGGRK